LVIEDDDPSSLFDRFDKEENISGYYEAVIGSLAKNK
jgi:hypothetical protein